MQNWILYSDEQLLKQIIKTDANVLYAENKIIDGYYVLDIKVFGSNSSKMKGSTVAPIAYPNYKWGNF